MFRAIFLPRIIWIIYRLFIFTWRVEFKIHAKTQEAIDDGSPIIVAHWHGDELALLPLVRRLKLCTMTSTSKDGALIDYIIKKLGGSTSKGSSTRGAIQALKGLVRMVKKEQRHASMAVDGPKGPIYKVKPGVFELARLTGAKIVPLAAHSSNAIHFPKAWNKTYLPKPFSRVVIHLDQPWPVFTKDQNPKSLDYGQNLANQINAAKQQAIELITGI